MSSTRNKLTPDNHQPLEARVLLAAQEPEADPASLTQAQIAELQEELRLLEEQESRLLQANMTRRDKPLAEVQAKIKDIVSLFSDQNIFRSAPSFDGSKIDWILGQDAETYIEGKRIGMLTEGAVDYFNPTVGRNSALVGQVDGFTGNNNVLHTIQTVAADGGTVSIGMELRDFGPNGPAAGVETIAGYLEEYLASGKELDLIEFLETKEEEGDLLAGGILQFGEIMATEGANLKAIQVRPGYEFDADFNGYTVKEYKDAFQFLHYLYKTEDGFNLPNVKMVWQSQAGAERDLAADPIYDEANGQPGPITRQDIINHLNLWYPGDEFVDIVGISAFQTQESADEWSFRDGTAFNGVPIVDDFELFLQTYVDFAVFHQKKLSVSEASPAGAYLDRDHFNELVLRKLEENPEANVRLLERNEVPYAKFHIDNDPNGDVAPGVPIEAFFDDSQPNFFISSTAKVFNEYYIPFMQFIGRNAEHVASINMISYNWDNIPLFESVRETSDDTTVIPVNFGSGNFFVNQALVGYVNGAVANVFSG